LCLKIKDGSAKKKQHILFMIPTEGGFPTTEGGIGLINSEIRKNLTKNKYAHYIPQQACQKVPRFICFNHQSTQ
jgi:hypothetical protein